MQEIAALYPDRAVFDYANPQRFEMFDKVSGSDFVRLTFSKTNRYIIESHKAKSSSVSKTKTIISFRFIESV